LISVYALALAFVPASPGWSLAQVVFWRVLHWVGLGAVLWAQSRYQTWTKHFTSRGRTEYEAFDHWKNIYNISLTLNTVTFVAAALRFLADDFHFSQLLSPSYLACFAAGSVLISLSVWSFLSTWEAVGEFSWFYGDFFIESSSFKTALCYTGIYRFLNNPDAVTGYAGQYGLALIAQSYEVFALALGSHLLNVVFIQLVEVPHMQRLYTEKEVRHESPFPRALKKIHTAVKQRTEAVKEESEKALRKLKRAAKRAQEGLSPRLRNGTPSAYSSNDSGTGTGTDTD